jgi:hypothetical protein
LSTRVVCITARIGSILLLLAFGAARSLGATPGYSYAGISSKGEVDGAAATITVTRAASVQAGHVAAWLGIGGPSAGPGGIDEWIQVGLADIAGASGVRLYYEAKRGEYYRYGELPASVAVGSPHRLQLLESASRHDWWQASVDGTPVGPSVFLPGSGNAWPAQVVTENWPSHTTTCNAFSFEFTRIAVRSSHASTLTPIAGPLPFTQGDLRLSRTGTSFRVQHSC